jgi:succinate-semialdehyde dehydrogenase/glutarate-semialdehyde dehydrogenase
LLLRAFLLHTAGVRSINPATGELIREYPPHGRQEVQRRIAGARSAFQDWSATSLAERRGHLEQVAAILRRDKSALSTLITQEMGKPITQSEAEIEKCAWACDFYAENAAGFLSPQPIATDASHSAIHFEPLGVILAVMPWNFPFWQVFRFAAPALMAGNVALLKHASNVSGCALAIENLFREAALPNGCFSTLLIESADVADVIRDPAVAAVTLTGSETAGSAIGAIAGRELKKCVMELGGSDAFIVLADANIDHAAENAVLARTQNAGQSCIAAKRFIVELPVLDRFTELMVRGLSQLTVGDPMQPETQVGPLARQDLVEVLDSQVRRSIEAGARLLVGGKSMDGRGCFYTPTALDNVFPGMAAFDEELFGPVAAIIGARDPAHAVELANTSPYGLGASIWTTNEDKGVDLASSIQAGSVFVNGIVRSDPRLPFGGIKRSGYGRELSREGIREFVNIKTVWLR